MCSSNGYTGVVALTQYNLGLKQERMRVESR